MSQDLMKKFQMRGIFNDSASKTDIAKSTLERLYNVKDKQKRGPSMTAGSNKRLKKYERSSTLKQTLDMFTLQQLQKKMLLPIPNQSLAQKIEEAKKEEYTKTPSYFRKHTLDTSQVKEFIQYKGQNSCKSIENSKNIDIDKSQLISRKLKNNNNNETASHRESMSIICTEEEKRLYGNRFIEGYEKLELIGRGGFALVWLAIDQRNNQHVAVKQITKLNSDSHKREISFALYLQKKEKGEEGKLSSPEGLHNLSKCLGYAQTTKDVFLVYELGGKSLGKQVYSYKGEFFKNERVYRINFTPLYDQLFLTKQNKFLKSLIIKITQALDILSELNYIHSDLKPENILVKSGKNQFDEVKIIDFGSSYLKQGKGQIGMITCEYMPPEVTYLYCKNSNQKKSQIEVINSLCKPHSIDVWSFGACLIEILTGLPHWLNYKCRVIYNNKDSLKTGLFAIRNNDFDKLLQKQVNFCNNFEQHISDILKNFEDEQDAEQFFDLLNNMMKFKPEERISPKDILKHPFLNS